MGENLVLHIARDWWGRQSHPSGRLHVTIIDRHAVKKTESLTIRYPQLSKSCELIPLQMEVQSPEFERADFLFDEKNRPAPTAIYICVDDDSLGLHAGLTLARRIPDSDIQTVIRMAEESGLAKLLEFRKNHHDTYRNLFAFGYLDHTCTPDLLKSTPRDLLARAAHEDYVRTQTQSDAISTGNAALQPWEKLDEVYRKANYQWVDHIPVLLNEAGYELVPLSDWDAPAIQLTTGQVESLAQMEHELWCKDKLADGWRFAPEEKSPEARTNPNLVAWEHLAEDQRQKNREMVRSIPAFLGRAGFQVVKTKIKETK